MANWLGDYLEQLQQLQDAGAPRQLLQIDPAAQGFHAGGPGLLGGKYQSTPLTQRWRNMVRGLDRMASETHDAAEAQRTGQPLDAYQQQLIGTPLGQYTLAKTQAYHAPEAWERRILSSLPGEYGKAAKYDENGQLSNVDEMRGIYANILRQRIANPISDKAREIDRATLADLLTRMQPTKAADLPPPPAAPPTLSDVPSSILDILRGALK